MNDRYLTVQDIVQILGDRAQNPNYRISLLQVEYWFTVYGREYEKHPEESITS